jgi:hypothetical protein
MTRQPTTLQKLNYALDSLCKLKESQAFFDIFNLVIAHMSHSQSTRPEIIQLDLLKDAYVSNATALIEEMENYLQDIQKELK